MVQQAGQARTRNGGMKTMDGTCRPFHHVEHQVDIVPQLDFTAKAAGDL